MYHCIMKVQSMDGTVLISGVVNRVTIRYQAEELVDVFRDLENSYDENKKVVCKCIMEVAGEEELLSVTTVEVSKNEKRQLQKVIDKMLEMYCSTGEGFMNGCKDIADIFKS